MGGWRKLRIAAVRTSTAAWPCWWRTCTTSADPGSEGPPARAFDRRKRRHNGLGLCEPGCGRGGAGGKETEGGAYVYAVGAGREANPGCAARGPSLAGHLAQVPQVDAVGQRDAAVRPAIRWLWPCWATVVRFELEGVTAGRATRHRTLADRAIELSAGRYVRSAGAGKILVDVAERRASILRQVGPWPAGRRPAVMDGAAGRGDPSGGVAHRAAGLLRPSLPGGARRI